MKIGRFAIAGLLGGGTAVAILFAQERTPIFRSKVDLVVLSFTVTDNKGKYVNGLKPSDFRISEDGIPQKLATFSEGNRPAMEILADGSMKAMSPAAAEAAA